MAGKDKVSDDDSDVKMRLAERAVAAAEASAAAAVEAAAASATGRHSVPGSGEFQAVLLSLVQELKTDSRESRQKLETVLVRLAEGDGRMGRIELQGDANRDRLGAIESRLVVVERTVEETRGHLKGVEARLTGIETGAASGIQKAVRAAVVTMTPPPASPASDKVSKQKSSDGWVSANVIVKVAAIAAGLLTTIITCYFAFRQTQVQVQAGAATTPAPAITTPAGRPSP